LKTKKTGLKYQFFNLKVLKFGLKGVRPTIASIKQAEDKLLPLFAGPRKLPNSTARMSVNTQYKVLSSLSHSSNHWWAFRSTLAARRVIASGFSLIFFKKLILKKIGEL
jgi:hypothetical protein